MKKRTPRFPLLSRKAKTLIYACIVTLLLFVIIAGSVPITPQAAFRLAEKANLLDPGTILGTESVVSFGQHAVIIAESEKMCMTYAYKYWDWNNPTDLACKNKTGDLTFMSIESYSRYSDKDDKYMRIILFDDYPNAVRAELDMELCNTSGDQPHQKHYQTTAKRQTDGYFLF